MNNKPKSKCCGYPSCIGNFGDYHLPICSKCIQPFIQTEEKSNLTVSHGDIAHSQKESKNCDDCIKVQKEFIEAKNSGKLHFDCLACGSDHPCICDQNPNKSLNTEWEKKLRDIFSPNDIVPSWDENDVISYPKLEDFIRSNFIPKSEVEELRREVKNMKKNSITDMPWHSYNGAISEVLALLDKLIK